MSRQAGSFRFSGVEHRSAGRTRPCSSTGLSPGHHTKEGGGPTAVRDGKTRGRLCVRPQRRVNCASHRSQAKAVLSTGTHCMCRQVLHRTFVPRTTVSDLLITANTTTTDPRSPPIGKRDRLVMKRRPPRSPGVRWLGPPAATSSTGWRLCVERAHRACRQATC